MRPQRPPGCCGFLFSRLPLPDGYLFGVSSHPEIPRGAIRIYREHLNQVNARAIERAAEAGVGGVEPRHRNGRYRQVKRLYGDYLYAQDRDKFMVDLVEWLATPEGKAALEGGSLGSVQTADGQRLHWERGYRVWGLWTDGNQRVARVSIGPRGIWKPADGYAWRMDRGGIEGEGKTLLAARREVERRVESSLLSDLLPPRTS